MQCVLFRTKHEWPRTCEKVLSSAYQRSGDFPQDLRFIYFLLSFYIIYLFIFYYFFIYIPLLNDRLNISKIVLKGS